MRYRRLQEKIKKQQGDVTTAPPASHVQPSTPKSAKKSQATRKHKAKTHESESEDDAKDETPKKIKLEDEDAPTERQTRGKLSDFKMLDDSSSAGVSTASASTNTNSGYEATASNISIDDEIEDDDNYVSDSLVEAQASRRIATAGQAPRKAQAAAQSKRIAQNTTNVAQTTAKRSLATRLTSPEDTTLNDSQTEASLHETAVASPTKPSTLPAQQSLIPDYDEVRAGLSNLKTGTKLPKRTAAILQVSSPAPDVEMKTEAATIIGPTVTTSARFRHSLNAHGSDLLQADMDRAVCLFPEDSVSMVGLVSSTSKGESNQQNSTTTASRS